MHVKIGKNMDKLLFVPMENLLWVQLFFKSPEHFSFSRRAWNFFND